MFDIMTSLYPRYDWFTRTPKLQFLHPTCLRVLFGDNPRLETFLAGEALGDTEALGVVDVRGEGALDGVLVGVLGDGVLLGELKRMLISGID